MKRLACIDLFCGCGGKQAKFGALLPLGIVRSTLWVPQSLKPAGHRET